MENVILVVHIIACIGLIGVVLLQRSEGGALGIGGGGGGGLMSGRGAASALTRTTMILAAVFFATSLVLTTISTRSAASQGSLADALEAADREQDQFPSDLDLSPSTAPAVPETSEPCVPSDLDAEVPSDLTVPSDIEEQQPTE